MNTNFIQLKILIQENNPTCACLQETRHGDKILKPPSGYKIITLNTVLQAVATKIGMSKWYTVCSIYLPHIDVERNDILNLLQRLREPFFLLGDMIARHHPWDEDIDNQT